MNSGTRLNIIFTGAVKAKGNLSTAEMWANVFGLTGEHELQSQVGPCLLALNSEIDATRAWLTAKGATPEMLEPCFQRLKQAAELARLGSAWKDYQGNLQAPEVRCTLAWVAWAMPDQEDPIVVEALQAMLADIAALEEHAQADGVSPFVRELALQTAETLRAGLAVYNVQGLKAIGEAMQKVAGSVVLQGAIIEAEAASASPETRTVLQRMRDAMKSVGSAADAADKWRQRGEAVASVYGKAVELFEKYVVPLLPGPGGGA
jgi:hypothetical protein